MPLHGNYKPSRFGSLKGPVAKILDAGTTDGFVIDGRRVVLLTSRGVKSGGLRKVPLMRVESGGEYAVIASNAGAPNQPDWYLNVKADPNVELLDGDTTNDYVAQEVYDEVRARWWTRAIAVYPTYAKYQATADRRIPILVLRRNVGPMPDA